MATRAPVSIKRIAAWLQSLKQADRVFIAREIGVSLSTIKKLATGHADMTETQQYRLSRLYVAASETPDSTPGTPRATIAFDGPGGGPQVKWGKPL